MERNAVVSFFAGVGSSVAGVFSGKKKDDTTATSAAVADVRQRDQERRDRERERRAWQERGSPQRGASGARGLDETLSEAERRDAQLDDAVDQIGSLVGNMKVKAQMIGQELGSQSDMLDEVGEGMDSATNKLHNASARSRRL